MKLLFLKLKALILHKELSNKIDKYGYQRITNKDFDEPQFIQPKLVTRRNVYYDV